MEYTNLLNVKFKDTCPLPIGVSSGPMRKIENYIQVDYDLILKYFKNYINSF